MISALLLGASLWLTPPSADDPALQRAHAVLARVPLVDGHNDLAWKIRVDEAAPGDVVAYDLRRRTAGHTDLPRLRQGRVGAQFWSVYVPGDPRPGGFARIQLEQLALMRQVIAQYPGDLELVGTADELERAFAAGKIASMFGVEGGHAIDDSLGVLRAYHALGARYMTLTHNVGNAWADAASDRARHGGLTRFGEEVVREMNRLGMLVDLSHVSAETMDDALRVSEAPVIFSHSSARALADSPRNVPDEVLRRVPGNGGVVMVTFVPRYVSQAVLDARAGEQPGAAPQATLAQVADHIEHVRAVAGVDHVGIGSDFDGMSAVPSGLEDVSRYPHLFAELARRGWTDAELEKLAGRNLLRVMRAAEATARRLQAARPASTATIERLDREPAGPRAR